MGCLSLKDPQKKQSRQEARQKKQDRQEARQKKQDRQEARQKKWRLGGGLQQRWLRNILSIVAIIVILVGVAFSIANGVYT